MPAETATLAIDVGATRTRTALVRQGAIVDRTELPTSDLVGRAGLANGLVGEARRLLSGASPDNRSVAAVGVSLAAGVDQTGNVVQERDFGIRAGAGLSQALSTAFEVPVAVNNDANLAALAEHELGAARGHDNAAVITLGSNIGLGLIVGGQVHRGAHGMAGEVGLLLLPSESIGEQVDGRRPVDAGRFGSVESAAPEGYAWIEELVGGRALATAASTPRAASAQAQDNTTEPEHPRILTREAFANPALRPLGERAVEGWALIIATLGALLDVEIVVLTGSVAADAAHLLNTLRRRVAELVAIPPEVVLGTLGPDAELLGADLFARAALERAADRYARAGLSAQSTGERR
ncbi:MAG: ROK family protein [Chloroflexi bacterium]|nr:MAG: ROK family protein [Chloroflexota bacterium]